tara:strand:+ start:388 stop:837 length:450 start_codon:yes stop_codon:yes gene_type:complete
MSFFNLFISILLLVILSSCQRNELVQSHGISFLEKRQENIIVNNSNRNDVRKKLGNPSTESIFDNTIWIYVERTRGRGKIMKLGQNITLKNNVLVLKFDKYGILREKEFYDKEKMQKINFSEKTTEGLNRERDFIYNFLSSMRQKMFKK